MFVNRNIIFSADGQLMDTGNDENPYKLTRLSFSGSSGFQPSSGKNAQSRLPLQTGLITPSAKNMLKLGIPKSKWGNHAFQTDSRCQVANHNLSVWVNVICSNQPVDTEKLHVHQVGGLPQMVCSSLNPGRSRGLLLLYEGHSSKQPWKPGYER